MDLSTINSRDATNAFGYVTRTRNPGGVSIISPKCEFGGEKGCQNFVGWGKEACPIHLAPRMFQDKNYVRYCPNCYQMFGGIAFFDGKHHCHICGDVFCSQCSDYTLLGNEPMPVSGRTSHRNPLADNSADRRICIKCACLIHPTRIVRNDQIAAFHTGPHVPLDICFLFDGTASMTSHLDLVEREIGWIVEDISSHHLVSLHLMAVTYRDHQYGERLLNTIPPQNHHHKFEKMVRHVHAFAAHNNDSKIYFLLFWLAYTDRATKVPEAMACGLGMSQIAGGGFWRPLSAKMIILFADAPPHGLRYSAQARHDAYPNGDPSGLDPVALVDSLAQDGVSVYTIGVEPSSQQNGADRVLRTLAAHGGGLYVPLEPYHHENLHHFISACACDMVMKSVVAQELQQLALKQGLKSFEEIPSQQRMIAIDQINRRMKSRRMPRFYYAKPTALQATPSTRDLPIVTGFHRQTMNDGDIGQYVDEVISNPPVAVPFASPDYIVAVDAVAVPLSSTDSLGMVGRDIFQQSL